MLIDEVQMKSNLEAIQEQIQVSAKKAGRNPDEITLMAVTKTKPLEVMLTLSKLGLKCFGENYPDEIEEKIPSLGFYPFPVAMIGHLQSRKAKIVADRCDAFHSLDRLDIAEKMERLCAERNRVMPVFLECNVGDEATKSGWHFSSDEMPGEFLADYEKIAEMPHLDIQGLMTLPPFTENGESNRPFFIRLREIRDALNDRYGAHITELSMGTSSDYSVAIEEGSTIIRIGTALAGAREYKK